MTGSLGWVEREYGKIKAQNNMEVKTPNISLIAINVSRLML